MIKDVFITPTPITPAERWKSELNQGLLLKDDATPDGFYKDLGVQFIDGKPYYVSIQVIL